MKKILKLSLLVAGAYAYKNSPDFREKTNKAAKALYEFAKQSLSEIKKVLDKEANNE